MNPQIEAEFNARYGTHTPTLYRYRLAVWFFQNYSREFGAPHNQPARNAYELANRRIGDAEKIACRLLAETAVTHPIARFWIERLVHDQTFAKHLDDAARDKPAEWLEPLRKQGMDLQTPEDVERLFEVIRDDGYATADIFDAIVHRKGHPKPTAEIKKSIDKAAVILATTMVDHRLYHEPDTEHEINVYGLARVTTSLASSVAEFHMAVANAYAAAVQRQELGIGK